jgi:hypothetical protein
MRRIGRFSGLRYCSLANNLVAKSNTAKGGDLLWNPEIHSVPKSSGKKLHLSHKCSSNPSLDPRVANFWGQ